MNQLYVSMHPVPLGPPSYPLNSTPLGYHRALSWASGVIQQLPTHSVDIYCLNSPPLHATLCPKFCSLHLHCCFCPANRFISSIFLDSIYMHYYVIFVFLFLTYFTLYDRL